VGHENPGDCAGDGVETVGETAAASEPSEGPFDDPYARQNSQALGACLRRCVKAFARLHFMASNRFWFSAARHGNFD
jgi:hypothetical protein